MSPKCLYGRSWLAAASSACLLIAVSAAPAATVDVDLSGATSGSVVTGVGASFAQTFLGQTAAGIGITGSPTNPLTLRSNGLVGVVFWDPFVAPASKSLLSQPGNAAPLSALLDSAADGLSFTSGTADGNTSFSIDFFSATGALVDSRAVTTVSGYANYSFSGLTPFAGFTIFDNTDTFGLRFQNFSYNSVSSSVPEPASWALMVAGFGAIGGALRNRRKVCVRYA
ncbi:PEPxxWA-CTERM sorting domain-containing protein [Sphingomonas sp. BIUV-7]|uniref:PEPxxWA-CTERM sorting domain-containing protein n=1 Tax=Sphingomonas natans TaxID=3063330 RepID=A0ABT8Y912_9SPHN|nr:PEPxxWA-CTERM sorting domain-containing protein [Sphingomonas sp. BIUV-7]MDO6414818.1 PEPxxWA-CTERM sorting domain-containing protein [Sphingomonas sp. BIUV-7]